jgi:hypothetical protein
VTIYYIYLHSRPPSPHALIKTHLSHRTHYSTHPTTILNQPTHYHTMSTTRSTSPAWTSPSPSSHPPSIVSLDEDAFIYSPQLSPSTSAPSISPPHQKIHSPSSLLTQYPIRNKMAPKRPASQQASDTSVSPIPLLRTADANKHRTSARRPCSAQRTARSLNCAPTS